MVLAVILVACGAGSGSGSGDDAGADPLGELLGWNTDASPAEQRAQQLAQEEAVAACMRAEGFEYTPVDYSAQFETDDEDAELYNDPVAFGEKYGYGVVRNYEQYEEPYLSGDGEGPGGPVFEDPNQDYVNSLSESERNAYYEVLQGEPIDFGSGEFPEGGAEFEPPPLEDQGCWGKAQAEVYGDQFQLDPEIQNRLNDYFTSFQDDPELEAANQDWLTCMKKEDAEALESDVEGFRVTGPDSMYQLVEFRKSAAMGTTITGFESDDQGGTSYSSDGEPTPIPDDVLETLRSFELTLWKVDRKCQEDADIPGMLRRSQERLIDELKADFPELAQRGDP